MVLLNELVQFGHNSSFKKVDNRKKIPYERPASEWVDDRLILDYIPKIREKQNSAP